MNHNPQVAHRVAHLSSAIRHLERINNLHVDEGWVTIDDGTEPWCAEILKKWRGELEQLTKGDEK